MNNLEATIRLLANEASETWQDVLAGRRTKLVAILRGRWQSYCPGPKLVFQVQRPKESYCQLYMGQE